MFCFLFFRNVYFVDGVLVTRVPVANLCVLRGYFGGKIRRMAQKECIKFISLVLWIHISVLWDNEVYTGSTCHTFMYIVVCIHTCTLSRVSDKTQGFY
jgi:hypothetical protein